jgi:predicted CoA-binding protein
MPTLNEMVDDFLGQQYIAVAGVSRGGQSPANAIYNKLKREGHTVYALNPNADRVEGDQAYPNVNATPHKPDGVVIVTNPELTDKIVHECVEAGIPRIWIHSSFAHGSSMNDAAVQYGQEHGVQVIAGGCPLMFGTSPDLFHKGLRWWMRRTGKLPA